MKIGLEVHVQLRTNTKLFCGCSSNWQGLEPNTNCCDTCLGFPGTKPRLNEKAIEYGIKIALALNCKFPERMFFSRKSYFYPDMSKNFQITQYEIPIAKDGFLKVGGKKIHINRINLEEDPARLVHPEGIAGSEYVLVDYNRSGIPLCEIVTAPDFETPREARIFLQQLSSILEYLGVFDPSMEASMRIDSNISIMDVRVEVKNITGFKDVEKAMNYEIVRQKNQVRRGKEILHETRAWDAAAGVTRSLRVKETEEDYGYIFEPDLTVQNLHEEKISAIKTLLPELASEKVKRYMETLGVHKEIAESIADDPEIAKLFERVIEKINPKLAASWFADKIKKTLNYNNMRLRESHLNFENIVKLLKLLEDGKITEKVAEGILREMVVKPKDPEELIESCGLVRIDNEKELSDVVDSVLDKNPKAVLDFKSGIKESFNFLVGQALAATRGRGDPNKIREILKKKLE